ncbi:hypothetical protein FOL46_003550, partial [Perkinsus olseni]
PLEYWVDYELPFDNSDTGASSEPGALPRPRHSLSPYRGHRKSFGSEASSDFVYGSGEYSGMLVPVFERRTNANNVREQHMAYALLDKLALSYSVSHGPLEFKIIPGINIEILYEVPWFWKLGGGSHVNYGFQLEFPVNLNATVTVPGFGAVVLP